MNVSNWLVRSVLSLLLVLGPWDALTPAAAPLAPHVAELRLAFTESRAPAISPAETQREKLLAQGIVNLLQEYHLRQQPLDDTTSAAAFEALLSSLDPSKLYLIEPDVQRLRQYALQLDDEMQSGQLTLAHLAGTLRRQKAALIAEWVNTLLEQPFDFTQQEFLEMEGKKRAFCPDDNALRERWRRVLKHDVLLLMTRTNTQDDDMDGNTDNDQDNKPDATETPGEPKVQSEAEARATLAKRYRGRFHRLAQEDAGDDVERFINALVRVYDPHTAYLPPFRRDNFDIHITGSLEGIGAVLSEEDGFVKVQSIVPGGASWRQGELKADDVITAVAQDGEEPVDVVGARLRDAVRLIRGKKGTVVKLTVRKPDNSIVIIPITRDVVWLEGSYVKAAVLTFEEQPERFAYIDVPGFYGSVRRTSGDVPVRRVSEDIRQALAKLASEKVRGLVLDLRGNSGGLLHEGIQLSGLFINRGPVVQVHDAKGSKKVFWDRDASLAFTGPVVILVDRFSASASEILAAALQDYGRAVVIGSVTHGKGTVQHLYNLDKARPEGENATTDDDSLGTMKITQYQFYRINGESIQLKGVTPDIMLPDPAAHIEAGERVREHPIPWNTVASVAYKPWSSSWDVPSLRAQSLARQTQSDAFRKIEVRTKLLQQRLEETLEPLAMSTWEERQQQQEAELKQLTLSEAARFTVHPVAYADTSPEAQAEIIDNWTKQIQKDPWIEEALRIVNDMTAQ